MTHFLIDFKHRKSWGYIKSTIKSMYVYIKKKKLFFCTFEKHLTNSKFDCYFSIFLLQYRQKDLHSCILPKLHINIFIKNESFPTYPPPSRRIQRIVFHTMQWWKLTTFEISNSIFDILLIGETDSSSTTSRLRHISLSIVKLSKGLVWFMVFNATFNNISVISWRSVLLVEETGSTGENHPHVARNWWDLNIAIQW
jgi:hypothetical protein